MKKMATIPTFNMRLVCCLRYEICKSETLLFIIFFFFFPFFFHFFGASVVPQLSNPNPPIPFFHPPVQLIGAFFFFAGPPNWPFGIDGFDTPSSILLDFSFCFFCFLHLVSLFPPTPHRCQRNRIHFDSKPP